MMSNSFQSQTCRTADQLTLVVVAADLVAQVAITEIERTNVKIVAAIDNFTQFRKLEFSEVENGDEVFKLGSAVS